MTRFSPQMVSPFRRSMDAPRLGTPPHRLRHAKSWHHHCCGSENRPDFLIPESPIHTALIGVVVFDSPSYAELRPRRGSRRRAPLKKQKRRRQQRPPAKSLNCEALPCGRSRSVTGPAILGRQTAVSPGCFYRNGLRGGQMRRSGHFSGNHISLPWRVGPPIHE